MISYLYYRFYRFWLKSSIAEGAIIMAALSLGVLFSINILSFWVLLVKYDLALFPSKNEFIILMSGVISFIFLYLFTKKRYKKIIRIFNEESNSKRINGNIILTTYIIFTFSFLLFIAFYNVENNGSPYSITHYPISNDKVQREGGGRRLNDYEIDRLYRI